jgi:hypothetical protein
MNSPETLRELGEPWGPIALPSGSDVERDFGSLSLRLRRVQDEVWLIALHEGDSKDEESNPVEDGWTRWSVQPSDSLRLSPALPQRPVVVSPERSFFLPPHDEARVYVRVPLFVTVVLENSSATQTVIADLPSLILSDTWVGTFTEGVLGYWLTTKARRAISSDLFEPYLAMCPLRLRNESNEALAVERFAVRTSHLSLFSDKGRIWADEVGVRYEGTAEGSEIKYTGKVPKEAPEAQQIAFPREPAPRGLRALTFGIRQLSGWGG